MNWTQEMSRELTALDLARAALGNQATAYDLQVRAKTISRDIKTGKIKVTESRAA